MRTAPNQGLAPPFPAPGPPPTQASASGRPRAVGPRPARRCEARPATRSLLRDEWVAATPAQRRRTLPSQLLSDPGRPAIIPTSAAADLPGLPEGPWQHFVTIAGMVSPITSVLAATSAAVLVAVVSDHSLAGALVAGGVVAVGRARRHDALSGRIPLRPSRPSGRQPSREAICARASDDPRSALDLDLGAPRQRSRAAHAAHGLSQVLLPR